MALKAVRPYLSMTHDDCSAAAHIQAAMAPILKSTERLLQSLGAERDADAEPSTAAGAAAVAPGTST